MIIDIKKLLSLLLLIGVVSCSPACSTKSPQRIAITSVETVVKTADAAIEAWASYVVSERSRIAKLPADQAAPATAALDAKEAKVEAAYVQYQESAKAAILAGSASADETASLASRIAAASAPLVSLIYSLTNK